MNIRCSFCQIPYAIGRNEMLAALEKMDAENLTHYDAHCPRCKRSTQIPRARLEMAVPNWREEYRELEKEMAANPQPEAPLPTHEAAPVAETESKSRHHHRTRAGRSAKETAKSATTKKKTAAKKK